jgi:carboxylesterase
MRQIQPGAEPFFYPGGETGCLLTHGFTASPQEVHRLGAHLAQHGYTVLGVRLFAHGTKVEDMNRARWTDWLASVEDGYHLLANQCERFFFIGSSVGGSLSLILARSFPPAGVVTLSTPIQLPPDPRLERIKPILKPLSRLLSAIPKGPPTWHDPQAQEERVAYTAYPLRAILELEALLAAMRAALPQVRVPAFLMHSKNDRFIPPDHMQQIYEGLGTADKTMAWVEDSSHVITCDAEREKVFRKVTEFIQRVDMSIREGG